MFNLLSYSLDQMVVQQEDNIREVTREMNLQKTELDTLRQSLNTLEDLTYSTDRSLQNLLNKCRCIIQNYCIFIGTLKWMYEL